VVYNFKIERLEFIKSCILKITGIQLPYLITPLLLSRKRKVDLNLKIQNLKIISVAVIIFSIILSIDYTCSHAQSGWQAETRLTNDPDSCITSPNNGKYIAVDADGTVHIVWADKRDRNLEIYHKMRVNGVWSEDERITFASNDSKRPILTVDALNRVHLIWNDKRDGNKEIYHRIWSGGSWNSETRVTNTDGDSFAPSAVSDGLYIHLVYMEYINGHYQIIYRQFGGLGWSAPSQLTNISTGDRMVPSIDAGKNGTLHVVWWDTREDPPGNTNGKIYYIEWDGTQWFNEELISDPDYNAMRPSIAVDDSGFVHVAWINTVGAYEQIHYRMKNRTGWQSIEYLTNDNSVHYHPSLDVVGNEVCLVYWDNHIDGINSEVFFKRKSTFWSGPTRISNSSGSSSLCCLVAEQNGNLHVAWVDTRDGNEEIYYREYIDPSTGIDDEDSISVEPEQVKPTDLNVFPNPFHTSVTFRVTASKRERCSLKIYDITGRVVREFPHITLTNNRAQITWNLDNYPYSNLSSGIYFAQLKVGKKSIVKKVIFIK